MYTPARPDYGRGNGAVPMPARRPTRRRADMDRSHTIAVVTPAYNCATYIEEALRSIEAQTRLPQRVVVVDDGSTDPTGRIVAAFAAHSRLPIEIVTQSNRGIAAARNAGVRRCEEDLIAFLDGDDTFYPSFLALAAGALLRHPELLLCFPDRDVVDAGGNFMRHDLDNPKFRAIGSKRLPDGVSVFTESPFAALVPGSIIPFGLMVRRAAIQEVHGFDEEMRAVEDKLFLMQLAKLGNFGFLDIPLGTWRQHGTSTSGTINAFKNAFYDDLALLKLERSAVGSRLTTGELSAIRAQKKKNSARLLYAASNEATPDFFPLTLSLVKEGRAPWTALPKACLRYGWRRMERGPGPSYARQQTTREREAHGWPD